MLLHLFAPCVNVLSLFLLKSMEDELNHTVQTEKGCDQTFNLAHLFSDSVGMMGIRGLRHLTLPRV